MIRVRLSTAGGSHVVDVSIPPFKSMPDVLVWGNRMFSWHSDMKIDGEPCTAEYREVFCYIVTEIKAAQEPS